MEFGDRFNGSPRLVECGFEGGFEDGVAVMMFCVGIYLGSDTGEAGSVVFDVHASLINQGLHGWVFVVL